MAMMLVGAGVVACTSDDGGAAGEVGTGSSTGAATSTSTSTSPSPSTSPSTSTSTSTTAFETGVEETGDGSTSARASDESGSTGAEAGVPLFVAQGHAGRTTVSCDDGQTWIADQSADDELRCFDPYDCDHDAGAGRGIAYGEGSFVANFGWGTPGDLRRSVDGSDWEVLPQQRTFGGVAYGQGVFIAGAPTPLISSDLGATWQEGPATGLTVSNVRRVAFVDADGGRFILVGEDGDQRDVVLSDDAGQTWWHPTALPASCGASIQTRGGIAASDDTIVILGGDGTACRSDDGGQTWVTSTLDEAPTSHLLWDDEAFVVWSRGTRWSSADGEAWTPTATTPADLELGPVARSDEGTLVGVRGGWQVWYEEQVFYRSTDGVQWDALPPSGFTGSHPIRAIAFGEGEACPAG